MSFHSGRVTFCRFRVEGDAPESVDPTTLATLAEHAFQERPVGAPDEVEAGWITGEHLLDTQFSYEKNGYGSGGELLLCALRLDTHKVPGELKYAYRRMNELALASANPSRHASRGQKRDAADTAERQIHEDLAAGRYRRSKMVPVLWDLRGRTVYCGAVGGAVMEQLAAQFRHSFNVQLSPLSAGTLGGQVLRAAGKGRDYEDLRPSPFTATPALAQRDLVQVDAPGQDLAHPPVPWVQTATDLKDFLGNEFLIWLWHMTETAEGLVELPNPAGTGTFTVAAAIDRALDMDCAWGVLGRQSLRSSTEGIGPTRLAEAGEALGHGKWPRKASLIVADTAEGQQWELTLQADQWIVSSAALPEAPEAASPRELIEARLELTCKLAATLDGLFGAFLRQRVSPKWPAQRQAIRAWIDTRRKRKS